LHENIFRPLGMGKTGVYDSRKIIVGFASFYETNGTRLEREKYIEWSKHVGSGCVYSTVEDLLEWHKGLDSGKLVTKRDRTAIFTPYKDHYGYGWGIWEQDGDVVAIHSGAYIGHGSMALVKRNLTKNRFMAFLSNYGLPNMNQVFTDIETIMTGKKVAAVKKPAPVRMSPDIVDDFVGTYEGFVCLSVKADYEKNRLEIKMEKPDQNPMFAYPVSANVFQHCSCDQQFSFDKDDDGNVCLWGIPKK
jgi:D-alanyl-D-alanine carboxypeptidase